ncbi:putative polysaccharide biosynthesis protein [Loigolactobacillus zhaoyuanensis]|uniref:Oligosaccharide flippase family protein n=1 Tax=Loigolactobacillus zhaoyuanensis TaxID=2486017 RepID=A0ABW8UEK6_9LACO|nr:polysaccharide biosynthesis protein [Loigolactobacillus zhaoyuanensis]
MQNKQMKHVVHGAFILSLASLIAKILSAVYRVPFQNLVGNTGFYVYQQIYPLYGIGMTFALSGLPVFISKLVAEQTDPGWQRETLRRSALLLAALSGLIFVGLQLGDSAIAQAMGDHQLAPLIDAVAWMFLFMPWLALSRGFFQGRFMMVPTALSQVAEQVVRVAVILIAAIWAVRANWSVYKMGTWAMSGAVFGALAASIVLAYYWQHSVSHAKVATSLGVPRYHDLLRRFLAEGGSLCLYASLIVLLQLLDSFSVKNNLVVAGLGQAAAKSLKGVYDRGQPLVQLGLVLATALSTSLLPSLTRALQRQRLNAFYRQAVMMIRLSFTFSVAAAGGLIALMPGVNRLLFGNTQGNLALALYMLSIVFVALISSYSSVFQSLGEYRLPTVALLVGLAVKLVFNGWAVRRWQINGASAVTILALVVMFLLIWWRSKSYLRHALFRQHFLLKLMICAGSMTLVVSGAYALLVQWLQPSRLATGGLVFICVILGGSLFLFLARSLRLLTVREWLALPLGKKFLQRFK